MTYFYDPHPGFLGAAVPCPEEVRRAAEALADKVLSVDKALARLRAATRLPGKAEISAQDVSPTEGWIRLLWETPSGMIHIFRLIRYEVRAEKLPELED